MFTVTVLYPEHTNTDHFNKDYIAHEDLSREKTGLPKGARPYNITRFVLGPSRSITYFQMFQMHFESMEQLQAGMLS